MGTHSHFKTISLIHSHHQQHTRCYIKGEEKTSRYYKNTTKLENLLPSLQLQRSFYSHPDQHQSNKNQRHLTRPRHPTTQPVLATRCNIKGGKKKEENYFKGCLCRDISKSNLDKKEDYYKEFPCENRIFLRVDSIRRRKEEGQTRGSTGHTTFKGALNLLLTLILGERGGTRATCFDPCCGRDHAFASHPQTSHITSIRKICLLVCSFAGLCRVVRIMFGKSLTTIKTERLF